MRVGVTLLDENGVTVDTAEGLVVLDAIDLDERAPFAIYLAKTQGTLYAIESIRLVRSAGLRGQLLPRPWKSTIFSSTANAMPPTR